MDASVSFAGDGGKNVGVLVVTGEAFGSRFGGACRLSAAIPEAGRE